jgi:diaminopimelate decarboxylase
VAHTDRIESLAINWDLLSTLSQEYGDAYYLLDSEQFARNYDELLNDFRAFYADTWLAYSYKTNYVPRLCAVVNNKGGYAEVVSEMEYQLASKLQVPGHRIIYNGPYKSVSSVRTALLNGSIVNLDSSCDVESVTRIAAQYPSVQLAIGLRCNFDIATATPSRFGFDADGSDLLNAVSRLREFSNVSIQGLHCHLPDRHLSSFVERTEQLLELSRQLFPDGPTFIDVGGGFFGRVPLSLAKQFKTSPPTYREYAEAVGTRFAKAFPGERQHRPKLILEPGTALVADTMRFVARVLDLKSVRGRRLATVAGSKFNLGFFSSPTTLPLTVYTSRADSRAVPAESVDIVGYTCIEGDYLYKGYSGPLTPGDFVVFDNVGSYSVVLKPPFIVPNVPIIEYDQTNNTATVLKRQESLDDVFRTFTFDQRDA